MKAAISQFDLSTLPKVSKAELALQKLIAGFRLDIKALNASLSEALESIEPPVFTCSPLSLKAFSFVKSELALSWFGADTATVRGYLGAEAFQFAISLERRSAKTLVHQALGGDATLACGSDLTPIEEGVFTFLISNVLFAMKAHFLDALGLNVRLAPFKSEDVRFSKSHALEMTFQLASPKETMEIKLLVEAHPDLLSLFQMPKLQHLDLVTATTRVSSLRIPFSAQIGELSLTAEELTSLEVNDVVVLEQTRVQLDSGSLSGEIVCHMGEPSFETVRGRLSSSPTGNYVCEISKF